MSIKSGLLLDLTYSHPGFEVNKMMHVIVFVSLAVASAYSAPVKPPFPPMQNPDLFGGDMLGVKFDEDRNVVPELYLRWTNATIPYIIDKSVEAYTGLIYQAMQDYHKKTCVRFVPRTDQKNYVKIFDGNGCFAEVGMVGEEQQLSLGIDYGCMFVGTAVHELGHAVGFYHEQNRSDRDQYLIIYWDNIIEDQKFNFRLFEPHENILYNAFDFNSIMIYGNTAFSKDGKYTMVSRMGNRITDPFDKQGLSPNDVERVNKMYNCKVK